MYMLSLLSSTHWGHVGIEPALIVWMIIPSKPPHLPGSRPLNHCPPFFFFKSFSAIQIVKKQKPLSYNYSFKYRLLISMQLIVIWRDFIIVGLVLVVVLLASFAAKAATVSTSIIFNTCSTCTSECSPTHKQDIMPWFNTYLPRRYSFHSYISLY